MATSNGFTVPDTEKLRENYAELVASGAPSIQRCLTCGHLHHPPRICCLRCLSEDQEFTPIVDGGVVQTMIWYWQPIDPRYTKVPYNVALVELDQGPVMVTSIRGIEDGVELIGARVRPIVAESVHTGRPVVAFVPEP